MILISNNQLCPSTYLHSLIHPIELDSHEGAKLFTRQHTAPVSKGAGVSSRDV